MVLQAKVKKKCRNKPPNRHKNGRNRWLVIYASARWKFPLRPNNPKWRYISGDPELRAPHDKADSGVLYCSCILLLPVVGNVALSIDVGGTCRLDRLTPEYYFYLECSQLGKPTAVPFSAFSVTRPRQQKFCWDINRPRHFYSQQDTGQFTPNDLLWTSRLITDVFPASPWQISSVLSRMYRTRHLPYFFSFFRPI